MKKSIHSKEHRILISLLREKREEKQITQVQLAKLIDSDQTFISKIENSERRIDFIELRTICQALNLSFFEFLQELEAKLEKATTNVDISIFPDSDADWSEENWKDFLKYLTEQNIVTYQEIASALLSALNPPQVGTGVASKKSFQKHYPKRKTMQAVLKWFYEQKGVCEDCGTKLELQADHVNPKENYDNPNDADTLDNLELRCRRCNVIKRPSHKKGGLTYLTAAAGLMWILFTKKPNTYEKYEALCRGYGMTMANIRFKEAWAMAKWLNKNGEYDIE